MTAEAQTKVYGRRPGLSYAATGYQFSDNGRHVLDGRLARAAGENVGSYAIGQGSLAASANYTIATGGDLTITPASLTVTAEAADEGLRAERPGLSYAATGFQFSDNGATS